MTGPGVSQQSGPPPAAAAGDDLVFRTRDATPGELSAATAVNHIDWMKRLARSSGGSTGEDHGVHWTCVSRAATEVTAALAQPPDQTVHDQVDRLLALARERGADRIGYWAFDESYRRPLGAWLGARGFRTGGRPHWMAVDLRSLPEPAPLEELTESVNITVTDRFDPRDDSELPCFHPDTADARARMAEERPRRIWHLVQWQGSEPVGQSSWCATTGDLGVCGLHDLVVLPDARVSGLGTTRVQWLLRFGMDLGARYLVTNAAQEATGFYRLMGFRSLGFGQTWWLAGERLHTPVRPDRVAFAEAIAEGDDTELARQLHLEGTAVVGERLANGMTPMEFAGASGAEASARWLTSHGAPPDVLAWWDLGWREEARDLLKGQPGILQARRPRSGKTLLHLAVERDDVDLVEVLLTCGIDLTVAENQYGGTALDWALQLRRAAISTAIMRAGRSSGHRPADGAPIRRW